jgi:hypothetical protein
MLCEKCGQEMEMGYGMAGGGIGPYFYCECGTFMKFPDPEMEDARQISEDARQVRQEDVDASGKDKGG